MVQAPGIWIASMNSSTTLIYIYFFYGLAFYAMGQAVLLEIGRTSSLRLARALPWMAGFGMIHGIHEWIEMFQLLGFVPAAIPIDAIRMTTLTISFACLASFGVALSRPEDLPRWTSMWRAAVLLAVCLLGMVVLRALLPARDWLAAAGVWVRYTLGVVGAVITSWALFKQGRDFSAKGMARFGQDLAWAATAFILYGGVGQMFGPKSVIPPSTWINADLFQGLFGVPVQLFRAVAAVVVATAMIRAMRVFEAEHVMRLHEAQQATLEAERRVQRETAQLNKQLQEAVSELSILFEMSRILSSTLNWDELLHQAAAKVADLLPARAALILVHPDRESLAPGEQAAFGFDQAGPNVLQAAQAAAHQALSAARQGEPLALYTEEQAVAVPLPTQGGITGSLAIWPVDERTMEHKRSLLLTLGQELAIAIANAHLYQQVQEREVVRGDLLRQTVGAQEEERKRIARELHDGIGQVFTALGLGLSGVEETMPHNPALAREQIGNLKTLSMRAIAEMRQLVTDLRPPQLDDLGLVPALHWLTDEIKNRSSIDARVQTVGPRRRLSPELETVLFRITQEALNNIAKHAQATHAHIRLEFCADQMALQVRDNGIGMTAEQINLVLRPGHGWGLVGIQERVMLVGGTFQINSSPGQGTCLKVNIPLGSEEA